MVCPLRNLNFFIKKNLKLKPDFKNCLESYFTFMRIECKKNAPYGSSKRMKATANSVRQFEFGYLLYKFLI